MANFENFNPFPPHYETTYCWNCYGTVIRNPALQDGPYGHFCPQCGHSLRYHPVYGEGRRQAQIIVQPSIAAAY